VPPFPSSVLRRLRVLLASVALALAMPAVTTTVRRDVSSLVAELATAKRSQEAPSPTLPRALSVPSADNPTYESEPESAGAAIRPSAVRVRAQRAFLLNCTLLC
jgi:hypothetical protein